MKLGVWRGSGIEQRQQKKLHPSVGVRRSGSGRGRGIRVRVSRWEGFWGFWTGWWENVEKRCVWCGSVCVCAGRRSAEGFEGALEKWRSGGAVERCGGAVKDFSKKKKEIRGLVLGESGNGL